MSFNSNSLQKFPEIVDVISRVIITRRDLQGVQHKEITPIDIVLEIASLVEVRISNGDRGTYQEIVKGITLFHSGSQSLSEEFAQQFASHIEELVEETVENK